MSKSGFVALIACGCLVAALPRFIAPTDNYISDSLGINQEFYIIEQPDSMTVDAGERVTYIVDTNINVDVSYQWQFSSDTGETWTDVETLGADKSIFVFTASASADGFYRCKCTYIDKNIYSSPVFLIVNIEEETTTEEQTEETTEETEEVNEEMTEDETEGGENDE